MSARAVSAAAAPWRRQVILVWIGWAIILVGFQAFVLARLDLKRPDTTLDWTASWTNADSAARHPYLQSKVLPGHAAWDSEFYISIALHGYDDPAMRAASPASKPDAEVAGAKKDHPKWVSLNHAFFPGYPYAMAIIARPLAALGFDPLGAATLAGVIVSLAGALAAMLALADIAAGEAGEAGDPLRAAFYLAVFPSAVFLAQVYAEALFLGLSFGSLAMMKRGRWGWAAGLAAAAVFTRATGVLLIIPFGWTWLFGGERRLTSAVLAAAPAFAYVAWRFLFGADFDFVETRYFGRAAFDIGGSVDAWSNVWDTLTGDASALTKSYYLVELAGAALWVATSLMLLARDRALALYGLAALAVVLTSGAALGMHRYALGVPSLFLVPAALGRRPVFDRLWSLASVLGLAVLAISFSFGFWAG